MKVEDFKSIKILNLEIERIRKVLLTLDHAGSKLPQKEAYKKLLQDKEEKIFEKKIELEKFITSIEDAELRLILTLKFIDLKSWKFISKKLHYDRSTVYKKYKNYIENQSK